MKRSPPSLCNVGEYNRTLGAILRIEKITGINLVGTAHVNRLIMPGQIIKPSPKQVRELWAEIAIIAGSDGFGHMPELYPTMKNFKTGQRETLSRKWFLIIDKRLQEFEGRRVEAVAAY